MRTAIRHIVATFPYLGTGFGTRDMSFGSRDGLSDRWSASYWSAAPTWTQWPLLSMPRRRLQSFVAIEEVVPEVELIHICATVINSPKNTVLLGQPHF